MMSFLSRIFKRKPIEPPTIESKMEEALSLVKLAENYERKGKTELAISTYRKAIEGKFFTPLAYKGLILLFEKAGRYQEAVDTIDEFICGMPDYWPDKVIFTVRRKQIVDKRDSCFNPDIDDVIELDLESFMEEYKASIPIDLYFEMNDAYSMDGQKTYTIKKSVYDEIVIDHDAHKRYEQLLFGATGLNNEGMALEKAGDISGAIARYEENILPGTYFTLHPYHRLCVLYRRAGDYDNEIRVIESCLARTELPSGKERDFFEDRLLKARAYQSSKTK